MPLNLTTLRLNEPASFQLEDSLAGLGIIVSNRTSRKIDLAGQQRGDCFAS